GERGNGGSSPLGDGAGPHEATGGPTRRNGRVHSGDAGAAQRPGEGGGMRHACVSDRDRLHRGERFGAQPPATRGRGVTAPPEEGKRLRLSAVPVARRGPVPAGRAAPAPDAVPYGG